MLHNHRTSAIALHENPCVSNAIRKCNALCVRMCYVTLACTNVFATPDFAKTVFKFVKIVIAIHQNQCALIAILNCNVLFAKLHYAILARFHVRAMPDYAKIVFKFVKIATTPSVSIAPVKITCYFPKRSK